MRDIAEDIGTVLLVVLVTMLVIGLVAATMGGVGAAIEARRCSSLSALATDYEFQWGLWTGCLVKMSNGFWVNVNEAGYILLEQVVVPE